VPLSIVGDELLVYECGAGRHQDVTDSTSPVDVSLF